jgi:hypothetical protein
MAPPIGHRGASTMTRPPGLDLYWIPLGAGAHVVRVSGRLYETASALIQGRPRRPLYHSTLVAVTPDARFVVEMTPIPGSGDREDRGVVAEGPVGAGCLQRFRIFRYEIRRWRDGVILDLRFAVGSPVRITEDAALTRRVLDLVPLVPTPVWGRDQLHGGEMWNSNSVTAWLLARAGLVTAAGQPPEGGRAPGWSAGVSASRTTADTTGLEEEGPVGWDQRPCCRAGSRSDDGPMEVDRNGLEVLGSEECLRLLGRATIGRIGLSSAALPTVLPVNFRLVGDRILFRTGRGSKLDAATCNAVVAFEVDEFDVVDRSGWSVVVVGVARDLSEDELAEIDPGERLRVARWTPGGNDRMVAISCELVSGRRIVRGLTPYDRLPVSEEART